MSQTEREIPINDSPFIKSLLKRTRKLYFTKKGRLRTIISKKDIYRREVLEVCLRLSSLLETLRLSRFFIGERKDVPIDTNLKIKNSDFLRYHLECYFVRITTFKDLMLKLYNRVYRFGFSENNGLENRIIKQSKADKNNDLQSLLEGLRIIMSHVSKIRNKIAHGGYHDDIDLILIEGEERMMNSKQQVLMGSEYNLNLKRFLEKNILDMYQNEFMMATFIILSYKNLYNIRKINERLL